MEFLIQPLRHEVYKLDIIIIIIIIVLASISWESVQRYQTLSMIYSCDEGVPDLKS